MLHKVKQIINRTKYLNKIAHFLYEYINEIVLYIASMKAIQKALAKPYSKIYYLGIPRHANLGDLAQGICIRQWLSKHYFSYIIVEIETNAIVNTRFSVLRKIKEAYVKGDIIVFQSGYTTTDLGGFADEMHRAIMTALPNANMLMLPQTIFFREKSNELRTAKCYNKVPHLLFLARDRVSYNMALTMFPDIVVKLFPDIVTTMIGSRSFSYARKGILFCCRDDSEKYYTDAQINSLIEKFETFGSVDKTDTTKSGNTRYIVTHAQEYIDGEIDSYAHYKLIITDRYHGTILSLAAGTPVIIIKTTDHKVITGAEWFKGLYDDYVFLANDLNDAYNIAVRLFCKELTHHLNPYFATEYYDKLPQIFDNQFMEDDDGNM